MGRTVQVVDGERSGRGKKSRRRSGDKSNACYIDCCTCLTITFVVVFLVTGGVILVVAVAPSMTHCSCSGVSSTDAPAAAATAAAAATTTSMVAAAISEKEKWRQCGILARQKNECKFTAVCSLRQFL